MKEPIDFVGDIFDPEVIEANEHKAVTTREMHEKDLIGSLERRRKAYASVFSKGHTDQEDIDIVLKDLAWFCRAYTHKFDPREGQHADKLALMKDGRCEVYLRILDHTRLDRDTLFVKYTTPT